MKRAYLSQEEFTEMSKLDWTFWLNWIVANVIGELIGLGSVAITATFFILLLPSDGREITAVITSFLMIVLGAFEGSAVGFYQSQVLETKIVEFNRLRWILATVIGAVTAWILGTIPSLLMSFNGPPQNSQPIEPTETTVALLAAGMGLVLGIVLGIPQWFELRRYIKNAGWWILANALAWTIGMPQIFAALTAISKELTAGQIVFIMIATIVSAGASVGAIHGLFLIWLLRSEKDQS